MTAQERQRARGAFTVINDKGLHTRPATELVKCATSYKAEVHLTHHGQVVNAKSLLGILMLPASRGSKISVEAEGEDAEAAICSLLELARNRFNISH